MTQAVVTGAQWGRWGKDHHLQGQFIGDSHVHQPFRVKLQSQNPTEKIRSSEVETDLLVLLAELPGEITAQNYRAGNGTETQKVRLQSVCS